MRKTILTLCVATISISSSITPIANAINIEEHNLKNSTTVTIEENLNELDYASMISSTQFPYLVERLKVYMQSNPNSSDEEINNYFKNLIIENYDANLVALDSEISNHSYDYANSLPILASKLGYNEKKVFNSNPAKGALVLSNAQAAIDMTSQHWKNTNLYHNMIMVMHSDILFGMLIMQIIVVFLMQSNLLMLMKKIFLIPILKTKWIYLTML